MDFASPTNIRGAGDSRGPIERHIRALQNALAETQALLLSGAYIDLAHGATGGNTALTTSFQTAFTLAYTPPTDWNTYKIQAEVWASAAGLTSGDQFQNVAQITGGGSGTGTIFTDDAAGTQRSTPSYVEVASATGAIDVLVRVRNNTAARGTVYVAGAKVHAVRTS